MKRVLALLPALWVLSSVVSLAAQERGGDVGQESLPDASPQKPVSEPEVQEEATPEEELVQAGEPLELTAPPMGYRNLDQIEAEMAEIANGHGSIELVSYGEAPSGKTLWALRFAPQGEGAGGAQALVVANLAGDRLVASEVAMKMAQDLVADRGDWERAGTLWVIPCANPDGFVQASRGQPVSRGAGIDDDRDGRTDEDGPRDLNGDGVIAWLRKESPDGGHYASKNDPRAMEEVQAGEKVEKTYRLHREGADVDGDQRALEDGKGGIRVDANFPHLWQQYTTPAGPYPLSEPESRALATFVIERPSIAWVWVIDDEDTLNHAPKGTTKIGIESTDPHEDDVRWLKKWGERWKEMGPPKAGEVEINGPAKTEHGKGNFADWAYYQRGILVLESEVWSLPKSKTAKAKKSKDKEKDKQKADKPSDEEARIAWADGHYKSGAFQAWTPFSDPVLGEVEIGGWLPLVRHNPPAEWVEPIANQYSAMVRSMAADFARLEWIDVEWNSLDDQGVVELKAKLANVGLLPTTSAMGVRTRTQTPVLTELQLPEGARILIGRAKGNVRSLHLGGDPTEFRWILEVPPDGPKPTLKASGQTAGQAVHPIQ